MKNLKLTFLIGLLLVVFSCKIQKNNDKQQIKYFDFVTEKKSLNKIIFDTIELLDYEKNFTPVRNLKEIYDEKNKIIYKYFLIENKDFLYFFKIFEYSQQKKLDSIPIPNFVKEEDIFDFDIINNDSIIYILSYIMQIEDKYFADSSFVLSNKNGENCNFFKFKELNIKYSDKLNDNDVSVSFMPNIYHVANYKNNKIFIFLVPTGNFLGEYWQKDITLVAYLDLKSNDFKTFDIHYPDIKWGLNFWHYSDSKYNVIFSHDDELLFSFRYTPTLIKLNYSTGNISYFQPQSNIIDKIYTPKSKEEIPVNVILQNKIPINLKIVYDKYRKIYYRITALPPSNKKVYSIISILDTNFNIIAETIMDKINLSLIPTEKYILFGNAKVNIRFEQTDNFTLIQNIKSNTTTINKPISSYFTENFKINTQNSLITLLWADKMCPGTAEGVIYFYIKNSNKLMNKNKYLVIFSQNSSIKDSILKYNINYVFVDSSNTFENYSTAPKSSLMPQILIYKKNKIINDTIVQIIDDKSFLAFQKYIIFYDFNH